MWPGRWLNGLLRGASLPQFGWTGGPIGRGNFARSGRRVRPPKSRVLMKVGERRRSATSSPILILLRSRLSAETPDSRIVWRLKDLMRPLATLDGRASATLILEVLALPLQTHGIMDGWKRIQALEIMLFEGATLPNDQTLAIIMPVVDELTSKWHSDNERSLLSMSFSILPFLEDPRAGIAALADLLERPRLSYEGIVRVVSALGHSRCDGAVDLLVSIVSKERIGEWPRRRVDQCGRSPRHT